jgi:hypothetical protein
VPDRRRFGHVDVVNDSNTLFAFVEGKGGGGRGCWGLGKGLKNGAVDPEHGTIEGRFSHFCTKGNHPK